MIFLLWVIWTIGCLICSIFKVVKISADLFIIIFTILLVGTILEESIPR